MRRRRNQCAVSAMAVMAVTASASVSTVYETESGLLPWVDVATPSDAHTIKSSRGESWTLIMSDEFNVEGRSFEAGDDHLWTAIELADGVNSALEVYSTNMTSTECDSDDNCYFYINTTDETIVETVWNDYLSPAGYEDVSFYYRSGMVQSWNKFCLQGGLIEVRAQLPGAVSKASGNPDVASGSTSVRAANIDYYPTWPGIWLMGNLGRALFTASTARMWPYSYNECNETVFSSQNQRISACDDSPGSGLNAGQGRGAPEIDILEGGGTAISSSIQVAPGMPTNFRRIEDTSVESCYYTYECTTKGANEQDVPTAYYESLRGHKSWYQGLRYGANNLCDVEDDDIQTFATINASITKGITKNLCDMSTCPGSYDPNSDLSLKDNGSVHWGINANGTCFPLMNQYTGAYLCSAGNTDSDCDASSGSTSSASEFSYQMDAVSSNWEVHMAAYMDWVTYTVEWVQGDDGYIRWEVEGQPIFEILSESLTNPPQDAAQMNPKKLMIEEPMYVIFNVALSSTWGSSPPNAGSGDCYGDGSDATTNAICDSFPMYLKIDYIRAYQDTSSMSYGCDPSSHPTKTFIEDNIDDYSDTNNPWTEVSGMAFCDSDADCTIAVGGATSVATGTCNSDNRCRCASDSWTGPRCTQTAIKNDDELYGPPLYASFLMAVLAVLLFALVAVHDRRSRRRSTRMKHLDIEASLAKPTVSSTALTNETSCKSAGTPLSELNAKGAQESLSESVIEANDRVVSELSSKVMTTEPKEPRLKPIDSQHSLLSEPVPKDPYDTNFV